MKKIFKALAITATAAAMCVGVGVAAGCNGAEEKLIGEYHYLGYYGQEYGMVVEVTVKNNLITGIKDLTNTENEEAKALQTYKTVVDGKEADEATHHEWHTVSAGWDSYFLDHATNDFFVWILFNSDGTAPAGMGDKYYAELDENGKRTGNFIEWDGRVVPEASTNTEYGWSSDDEHNWTDHTSWLLDQYIGWSVADILDLTVYTNYGYSYVTEGGSDYGTAINKDAKGEPYKVAFNSDLNDSGLLISGSTQGSGRLMLAVQDALRK